MPAASVSKKKQTTNTTTSASNSKEKRYRDRHSISRHSFRSKDTIVPSFPLTVLDNDEEIIPDNVDNEATVDNGIEEGDNEGFPDRIYDEPDNHNNQDDEQDDHIQDRPSRSSNNRRHKHNNRNGVTSIIPASVAHPTIEDEDDEKKSVPFILPSEEKENLAELSDSSEDETDMGKELKYKNRIGNIPISWYAGHDHIGYGVNGHKLLRQNVNNGDSIDSFLSRLSDPNTNRTIYDAINDEYVTLTDHELESLHRLRKGSYAHLSFDPYYDYGTPYIDTIRHEMIGNAQEAKHRFIPSRWEAKKIVKLVHAMRMGWLISKEESDRRKQQQRQQQQSAYLLWGSDGHLVTDTKTGSHRMPTVIPAPRLSLPGHAHSYNPPAEYLFTPEEEATWHMTDPADRTLDFIPKQYNSMREIPAYSQFINDRFDRCLDLYLCPRMTRKKLNIDPQSLIPSLPKPQDLRPFPTTLSLIYKGHTDRIRSISISPSGQWLVSGSEDGTIRLWEVNTARCFKIWRIDREETNATDDRTQHTEKDNKVIIEHVAFNPNSAYPIISVCVSHYILLLRTGLGSEEEEKEMDVIMKTQTVQEREKVQDRELRETTTDDADDAANNKAAVKKRDVDVKWQLKKEKDGKIRNFLVRPERNVYEEKEEEEEKEGAELNEDDRALLVSDGSLYMMILDVGHSVLHCGWHHKGDYFSSTSSLSTSTSHILIHRLSQHQSQAPFVKAKGHVTSSHFHPIQPFFILCCKTTIIIYHLLKQTLVKKLIGPIQYISSISIHSSGDHILVSGYDRKVSWYDLDLSSTPYKTLKYHRLAVRCVAYHPHLPLFTSISDDGQLHIFHATIYTDLLTNPLIVPVKIIQAHDIVKGIGGMTCVWHPTQPWLLSAGADQLIKLWV